MVFVKGKSGNISGRPKMDPALKKFKETTYKDFLGGLQKYGAYSPKEMEAELERANITMFEMMFGNIVYTAAKGDKDARALLLDRLWGKVKDQVQSDTNPLTEELKQLTLKQLLELVAKEPDDNTP